jgi:hypothetical protein
MNSQNSLTRNFSIILSPKFGYSLMQFRDDIPGREPIQFFGGWFKGIHPKYVGLNKGESIGHAIYREIILELGLALKNILFLPFPKASDYIYKNKNNQSIAYLTYVNIKEEWIESKNKVQGAFEIPGKLNLREGCRMDVFKLEKRLLKSDLYENDRRMLNIYLENREIMEQSAFKIDLHGYLKNNSLSDFITVIAE